MADSTTGLQEEIVKIFASAVKYVFDKERNDSDYIKQTFLGTRFRAFRGIFAMCKRSFKDMSKLLALAIATHRQESHGEDKSSTISSLSRSLELSDIEVSSANFWN